MSDSTTDSFFRCNHISNGNIFDKSPLQKFQVLLDCEYGSNGKGSLQTQIENGHAVDPFVNANMGGVVDPTNDFPYQVYKVMGQDTMVTDLTEDLLHLVFSFLDQHSLCASAMVCRQWHSVSMCEEFWQTLIFEGDGTTAEKVGWLCMKYPKAVGLSLKDVPCVDEIAREAMFCLQWLERLTLHQGNLTDFFFSALSHGCHTLNELTITDMRLGNEGTEDIIICHETLHKLQILKCYAINVTIRCPMLDKLSLKGTSVASARLQCPVLRSLDLSSCCNLSDESLCSAIIGCPALLNLDVSYCACVTDCTLQKISLSCLNLRNLVVFHCPNVTNETVSLEVLNGMRSQNFLISRSTSTVTDSYCLMFKTVGWDSAAFLTSVFLDFNLWKNMTFTNCDRLLNLMLRFHLLLNTNMPRNMSFEHNSVLLASRQRLPIQLKMSFTLFSNVDLVTRFCGVRGVHHGLALPITANFKFTSCSKMNYFARQKVLNYLAVVAELGRSGTGCRFSVADIVSTSPVFLSQRFLIQNLPSKGTRNDGRVGIFNGLKVYHSAFVVPSMAHPKGQGFRFLPNFVHTSLRNIIKEKSVLPIQDLHKKMFRNSSVASLCWHFQVTQTKSNGYLIPHGLEYGTMPLFWNLVTNDSKYKATVHSLQYRRYINNVQLECRYYICKRSINNVQLRHRCYISEKGHPSYNKQIVNCSEPYSSVQLLSWNIQEVLSSLYDVACTKSIWNPFMLNTFLSAEKMQFNVELCHILSCCTAIDEVNTVIKELSTCWQQVMHRSSVSPSFTKQLVLDSPKDLQFPTLQLCSGIQFELEFMLQEICCSSIYLPGKTTRSLKGYYMKSNPVAIVKEYSYMERMLNSVSETSTMETENGEVIPCVQLLSMILHGPSNLFREYSFCCQTKSNVWKFLYEIAGARWNDPHMSGILDSCKWTWLNHSPLEHSINPSYYEIAFYLTSNFHHGTQKAESDVPCSVPFRFVQFLNIINHPGVQIAIMKAICLWDSFAFSENIIHIKQEFLYLTVLYFCEYIALQELLLAFSTIQPWAFDDISRSLSVMQLIYDQVL